MMSSTSCVSYDAAFCLHSQLAVSVLLFSQWLCGPGLQDMTIGFSDYSTFLLISLYV